MKIVTVSVLTLGVSLICCQQSSVVKSSHVVNEEHDRGNDDDDVNDSRVVEHVDNSVTDNSQSDDDNDQPESDTKHFQTIREAANEDFDPAFPEPFDHRTIDASTVAQVISHCL